MRCSGGGVAVAAVRGGGGGDAVALWCGGDAVVCVAVVCWRGRARIRHKTQGHSRAVGEMVASLCLIIRQVKKEKITPGKLSEQEWR